MGIQCNPNIFPILPLSCLIYRENFIKISLQWRHYERDGVSNHQPHNCLLKHLFRRRSKKTSKLRVTGLGEGNSLGSGEFPAQMTSNAENVSIWWRHQTYFANRQTDKSVTYVLTVTIISSYKCVVWGMSLKENKVCSNRQLCHTFILNYTWYICFFMLNNTSGPHID